MADLTAYVDEKYEDLDTDSTSTSTAWVDVTTCSFVSFYVEGITGDHDVHKVGVECSPDGTFNGGFHDVADVIILGEGHYFVVLAENMRFIRLSVQTAEGGTSTCDFYLQAFRPK